MEKRLAASQVGLQQGDVSPDDFQVGKRRNDHVDEAFRDRDKGGAEGGIGFGVDLGESSRVIKWKDSSSIVI